MKTDSIDIHRDELSNTGVKIWQVTAPVSGRAMQAHRDDHFIFIVHRNGSFLWELDFNAVEQQGPSLSYIAPGQVHRYVDLGDALGWLVFVEADLISAQGTEILNACLNSRQTVTTDQNDPVFNLTETLELSLSAVNTPIKKAVVNSLALAFTTMFAARLIPPGLLHYPAGNQQLQMVTSFKQLLSEKFREVKEVRAYAALLHITPLYLNQVVKAVTGFTASYWINQQILLEAKRLLYYTGLDVKQVAYELGYDDPAYFSRFFKKNTGRTAQNFRSGKP